jgi:hypothetical protein
MRDLIERGPARLVPANAADILRWAESLSDGAANAIGEVFGADTVFLEDVYNNVILRDKLSAVVGSDKAARLSVQDAVVEFRDNLT